MSLKEAYNLRGTSYNAHRMYENVAGTAKRVLAIGVPLDMPFAGTAVSPAAALARDGMLILMEGDRARADRARQLLFTAGLAARASVIAGDPRRMLYKLAGPFDVIFCDAAYLSTTIERLLSPDGVLITNARE